MKAALWLAGFALVVSTVALRAQTPILQLERTAVDGGNTWTGRRALAFRVTVLHPAMRSGGAEDNFVFDLPGGWRGALQLSVTDAAGKSVEWPFVNLGKDLDQPLNLHRQGTASGAFLLEPGKNGPSFPAGKYQVRARLASSTGKWRGRVESPPVLVEIAEGEQPGLQLVGLGEGPMLRGWPLLIGVQVTAPDGYDAGLPLPVEDKDWSKGISLTLADGNGSPVALPVERLPLARELLNRSQLAPLERRTIWFRVAGEATRSLGGGPYRWLAKFTLPASNRSQYLWSGTVTATTAAMAVVAAPVPLPAELARRQTWAQVGDLLVEAKLIRDRTEGGYMNDRMTETRLSAAPLLNAERLALQWHNSHPDDADGAVLAAHVMAAQEDKARADAYLQRAIEIDRRQRSQGGAVAQPSFGLHVMARGFEAMPDERHSVLTPELRNALQQGRAGTTQAPGTTVVQAMRAPVPAPIVVPTTAPASAPPATLPALAPVAVAPVSLSISASPDPLVTTAPAVPSIRSGEPSHGTVIPAAELIDARIRADSAGQWAASATAGSQYDRVQYSAAQATGAPNVNVQGNSPDAWCPAVRDQGADWLEVTFAKPVNAVEVRVRQNDAAGAIAKIEAMEANGTTHLWWQGVDPYKAPAIREIVWFAVRVPKTTYLVARVKITLNLASGPGYKEIDAVQLVAAGSD